MDGYGFVNEILKNGIKYQIWRSITDPRDEQLLTIEIVEEVKEKDGKPVKNKQGQFIKEKQEKRAQLKIRIKNKWGELWRL